MSEPSTTFILKIAGACNLNCTYCYMYNLGDTTFRLRPNVMDRQIAQAALRQILAYANRNELSGIALSLHGGEPLLVGKRWMRWFYEELHAATPSGLRVQLALQTNGTLLDEDWLEIFHSEGVSLGVSMDGPREWHDRNRVNHAGHGSYDQVRRAIDLLVDAGKEAPRWGVLTVANPEFPGIKVLEHFLDIGVRRMDFLWPDHHHDMVPPWPAGSLADYYIQLFDAWYDARDASVNIRWFETVIEMVLGANSRIDALGPQSLAEVVVETDGSLEPLDVLRTCRNGITRLGLNVLTHTVEDLRATQLFQLGLHNQEYLSDECRRCSVLAVCGGGYLPHRWGRGRGFRNPSVHSSDLFKAITHIKDRISYDLALALESV